MPRPEPTPPIARPHREAVIDLSAIRENVLALRARIGTPHTIAVVKANGYGHGAVESARAALNGGADRLGVADLTEAVELRDAGIEAPVLAWLHDPDTDFTVALERDIEVGVSSLDQLRAVADAAARAGRTASVQLKLDTGLSRNGVPADERRRVFEAARVLEADDSIRVIGIFSHVSGASPEDDLAQADEFDAALAEAHVAGLAPELVHLASSGPALTLPQTRYNTVRLGIVIYGLTPYGARDAGEFGVRPAMSLQSRVAAVRRVPADAGVSYDFTYRTPRETTLILVPIGYADGVPRQASGRGPVSLGGERFTVSGRVAMDQFVVDVGDHPVSVGDRVDLFGDPSAGAPSADDWARAADTIGYEIVTRLGRRVVRRYIGE